MSSVVDSVFFGRDKTAIDRQRGQNEKTREYAENMRQQSRDDMMRLFGPAQDNLNMGFQGAFDVFGQSMPQGMNLYQQGNVAAQNHLLAGLPQMNNAILGLPTDMSGFQPTQLQYDTSWMQQQMPNYYASPADLLGGGGRDPMTGGYGNMGAAKPWENRWVERVRKYK